MPDDPSAKRILFVITKAFWGGAQRNVYDLAVAAQQRGYAVTVCYGTDGLLRTKLEAARIPVRELPSLSRDIRLKEEWESFKEVRALIRELRPDIIHVHSSKAGLALLAAKLEGVPLKIFTAHGWAFNEKRPWWQKLILRCIYAATVYLADTTICVSNAIRKDIAWLPGVSLATIMHGVDEPSFLSKEEARRKLLTIPVEGVWVGMLAELHPTKRVQDAIDAVAELTDTHPELHLVVMGGGEQKEWLLNHVKQYGLEDRVHLLGFVIDAPEYLKAFDYFLMISRTEALGLALLEAGYAGLPVIATRVGGIPEIVRHKHSGVLVPAENPHALARALRLLLEDPDTAHRYAARLEEETREKFSKERMITATFALYEK